MSSADQQPARAPEALSSLLIGVGRQELDPSTRTPATPWMRSLTGNASADRPSPVTPRAVAGTLGACQPAPPTARGRPASDHGSDRPTRAAPGARGGSGYPRSG